MKMIIPSLHAKTTLGVHEWEKQQKRDVILTLEIEFDGHSAAKSDHIGDTLDYQGLTDELVAYLNHAQFELIEALAEALIDKVWEYSIIKSVNLELQKPGAITHAPWVAICTSRSR